MQKPVLDLDQLEYNGSMIYDAHKQRREVRIKYFDNEFKEITCSIIKPMSVWDMDIKCSNSEGEIEMPFNWVVQVESV
ncbi:YolD-like protein [Oceanobacillus oncorhynchi]|uniref:YolD-like protein n=1 Tax=Oceanobacillus oncorhynchi TaxID=545501 RepID=A0A0A1ME55_9BACI|nr:YolD-like family protein [Oceanobacillus oncorhynchi]CEI81328.1 YolD-like protein [Oceanobacillus oncorhynchi]